MVSKKQQVNAVNDSTITSSISWWHGWHLFHCISPMSLQDRTIFTDKQHLATDLARLPRTVSPGEQWCTLICERSEWFHKNKFDIMMAWMTPVSLHFSDVSTGSNNLYRLTTLGYWFSTFATNSLSRRTVVQINFCPPHSVPCATWPANLPAATRPPRHRGDCAKGARQVFSQAATGRHPLQSSCNPRRAKHIKPQRFDWCLQSNGRARAWIRPWSLPAWTVSRVGHKQFSTVPNKKLPSQGFVPANGAAASMSCPPNDTWRDRHFLAGNTAPNPLGRLESPFHLRTWSRATTVTFTDRVSKMSFKLQAALMLPSSTDARAVGLQITAASNGHSSMDPKL